LRAQGAYFFVQTLISGQLNPPPDPFYVVGPASFLFCFLGLYSLVRTSNSEGVHDGIDATIILGQFGYGQLGLHSSQRDVPAR
jgi:hypothetical protein